jgi:hypothetical protein
MPAAVTTTTAEAQRDSTNAMFVAARCGEIPAMKWLLSDGGANITAVQGGKNIWQLLERHILRVSAAELSALLRVMVLQADPPYGWSPLLAPMHAQMVARGRRLRAQLLPYLEQQRTLVAENSSLPAVLQTVVIGYAAPTREDVWREASEGLTWLSSDLEGTS